jgi:hypothetical protein
MTPKTSVFAPEASGLEPKLIEILLAHGFVATEIAFAFDSFRIANRLAGREVFRLSILSGEGANTLRWPLWRAIWPGRGPGRSSSSECGTAGGWR